MKTIWHVILSINVYYSETGTWKFKLYMLDLFAKRSIYCTSLLVGQTNDTIELYH